MCSKLEECFILNKDLQFGTCNYSYVSDGKNIFCDITLKLFRKRNCEIVMLIKQEFTYIVQSLIIPNDNNYLYKM